MTLYTEQMRRKDEHVGHATQQYQANSHPDLAQTRFVHQPLPEMNLDEVVIDSKMAGYRLHSPFYINAMTGGSPQTTAINQRLAQLAHQCHLAMATGSMSIAMKDPATIGSFSIIRKENPNGILFANLGAHYNLEAAKYAVDLIEANGLQIHLNVAQELIMPEGDRHFQSWLKNIEQIATHLEVPVIVKEVGFGFSKEAIRQLVDVGVHTIDISGRGGTNFARIENARRQDSIFDDLMDWGQSTVISLLESTNAPCEILASGGIHSPLDIVKCLALGANAVGLSGEFLHLIRRPDSVEQAVKTVHDWQSHLKTLYTLLGAKNTHELQTKTHLVLPENVTHWCESRGIDWRHFSQR